MQDKNSPKQQLKCSIFSHYLGVVIVTKSCFLFAHSHLYWFNRDELYATAGGRKESCVTVPQKLMSEK